jgi:hypothetical protein
VSPIVLPLRIERGSLIQNPHRLERKTGSCQMLSSVVDFWGEMSDVTITSVTC